MSISEKNHQYYTIYCILYTVYLFLAHLVFQQILWVYMVPVQATRATNTVRVALPAGLSSAVFQSHFPNGRTDRVSQTLRLFL
jgi:hypothetical protein